MWFWRHYWFPKFWKCQSMILKKFRSLTGVGVEFVGVGVDSESEIRDSAHLWCTLPISGCQQTEMDGVRKIDSKTGSDPTLRSWFRVPTVSLQSFDSDSKPQCPSLPCFYTHEPYILYTSYHNTETIISVPICFSRKFKSEPIRFRAHLWLSVTKLIARNLRILLIYCSFKKSYPFLFRKTSKSRLESAEMGMELDLKRRI